MLPFFLSSVASSSQLELQLLSPIVSTKHLASMVLPCSAVGTRVTRRVHLFVHRTSALFCEVDVDSSGVHGPSCSKSAGRNARRSALNDLVKWVLTSVEVPSRLEPRHILTHELRIMQIVMSQVLVQWLRLPRKASVINNVDLSRTHIVKPIAVETLGCRR